MAFVASLSSGAELRRAVLESRRARRTRTPLSGDSYTTPSPANAAAARMQQGGPGTAPEPESASMPHPEPAVEPEPEFDTEVEAEAVPVPEPVDARSLTTAELKRDLLLQVAHLDRGFACTPAQHASVLSAIAALEASAECIAPVDDPRIFGTWELLYTNALDIMSIALSAPVARVCGVQQNVTSSADTEGGLTVTNVVDLEPFAAPVLNLFDNLRFATRLKVVADATPRGDDARRVDIAFKEARISQLNVPFLGAVPNSIPELKIPMQSPVGYIVTSFLDDEIRVARAPPTPLVRDDGVFLLARVQ